MQQGLGDPTRESWRRLWGKTSAAAPGWHPLSHHLLDVGLVGAELLRQDPGPAWVDGLQRASGWPRAELLRWVPYFLALHDLGKASPSFQQRDPVAWARVRGAGLLPPQQAREVPHAHETFATVARHLPGCHPRMIEVIRHVLGAHHGRWVAVPLAAHQAEVPPASTEPWAEPWNRARQELVQRLRAQLVGAAAPPPDRPAQEGLLAGLMHGLVILADWLGSDESVFPPAGDVPLEDYLPLAGARAEQAVARRGLSSALPPMPAAELADLFPSLPCRRPIQDAVEPSRLNLPDAPFLAVLEAPTGEGKTEAALLLAARAGNRCYYALPTQATSNQMYRRMRDYLARRGEAAPVLVHGLAELAAAGDGGQVAESELEHDAAQADAWFRGRKRAMLAPYGVGTVDQALFAGLLVKHVGLRLLGLAGKVVIIDEVHAYDLYMSTVLDRLLVWLAELGSSVILLSATLPRARRNALLTTYAAADDEPPGQEPYPLLTIAPQGGIAERLETGVSDLNRRTVALERRPDDRVTVADELLAAVADGGCAMWIVNTVREAQEAYTVLRQRRGDRRIELLLYHAQFLLAQRQAAEALVEVRFGPGPGQRPATILVATQVVEQSLDLDADLMVTQLAPADLLLQRMGRLHRHRRTRPAGLEAPRLLILDPPADDDAPRFGGSGAVYDQVALLRTLVALHGRHAVRVPDDVRELVEAVYDPGREPDDRLLAAVGVTPAGYGRAVMRSARGAAAMAAAAELRLLGLPRQRVTHLFDALAELDDDALERQTAYAAATRYGLPSVRCVVLAADDPLLGRLSPARRPDADVEWALLQCSTSISRQAFVAHAIGHLAPHPGWQRSGILRPFLHVPLEAGAYRWDGGVMRVDDRLGVVFDEQ